MRSCRWMLILGSVVWVAMIVACTGAGGKWIDLPGGQAIYRSDHRDYYSAAEDPQRCPGCHVDGHITHVAFDERFILFRRDVCQHFADPKPGHRVTGVIEFTIREVDPPRMHGPFTEAALSSARERLGVPPSLAFEPVDEVRARLGPPGN